MMAFSEDASDACLPEPNTSKAYLLYLHIPFCFALCPFCSFHKVKFEKPPAAAYFACLREEIERVGSRGYRFDEIYVGGGTPTVLPEELAATLELVRKQHVVGSISIETNPDHLAKDSVQSLGDAGVNRLSVGVQSFDDALLREMQRFDNYGSGDDIRTRLKNCGRHFDTLNVDMIFNFPHQTEHSLRRDLDIIVDDIGAEQVSYYPLMASDSTSDAMLERMGQVEYSRERGFYELIADRLLAAGYSRSSAWCFSRKPGLIDEYIVEREDYVGLGSGAFSYVGGKLFASTFLIPDYCELIHAGRTGVVRERQLTERDQQRYYLLMRLFGGEIDKAVAETRFDGGFEKGLWPELAALKSIGAIHDSGDRLKLTENGYYIWIVLMREFFAAINALREQLKGDGRQPARS